MKVAPRGSSAALLGWRNEHWRVLLDEEYTTDFLYLVAAHVAKAEVPQGLGRALTTGSMVALQKDDGGVRGIVAGETLRRLVARTLTQQYGEALEEECGSLQFAFSTRAGTECVSHMIRAATELDPELTVLSIDEMGAYDLMRRQAMLSKLQSSPKLLPLLPFVRLSYGQPSRYWWRDKHGKRHVVKQGEGGEQGDPLMPALFCLGLTDTLSEVKAQLQPGEQFFAYLDDIYVLCKPARVKQLYLLLKDTLKNNTGLDLNEGKTRVYNQSGTEPEGVRELGAQVWTGALDKDPAERGLKVLGTPVGTAEFMAAHGAKWTNQERKLWKFLEKVPDLQSAWLLLLSCSGPRFNYRSRTVPPQHNGVYAKSHDQGMWATLCALLQRRDLAEELESAAAQVASLPLRKGGLGLRSARRTGPAAYWASWADTLPMMTAKCPDMAHQIFTELEKGWQSEAESLTAVAAAKATLQAEGYAECPTWRELSQGKRPPRREEQAEPGEYRHGWQYEASSRRETYYRDGTVLNSRSKASQAMLRSQAGRCAGEHLTFLPVREELHWESAKLRVLLLRR